MLKIKLLISILFLFVFSVTAQKEVNSYKYVIVPSQYEFQQNAGDYQLNEMTKFLFNKYGFNSLLSTDIFPKDLGENRCLALTAHLRKKSTFFTTKMKYDLVNCYNEVVYTSVEASSKNKDYERAYQEAIKKTFESIKLLNYHYLEPKNTLVDKKVEVKDEILIIPEEKIIKTTDEIEEEKIEIIDEPEIANEEINSNVLFAKKINKGYHIVDNTQKLVYILQATSLKDVYFIKDKSGIIFKQNGKWFIEYYFNNKLIKRELNINF